MRLDVEPQGEVEADLSVNGLPLERGDQVEEIVQDFGIDVGRVCCAVENGAMVADDVDAQLRQSSGKVVHRFAALPCVVIADVDAPKPDRSSVTEGKLQIIPSDESMLAGIILVHVTQVQQRCGIKGVQGWLERKVARVSHARLHTRL